MKSERPLALHTLPLDAAARHPDVILVAGVVAVVTLMILPLPAPLLDTALALNLATAAIILVAVLLSERPLALSTFPTLLLITTLFRLALNVSTTRMILAHGSAGEVVAAFGHFVVQGDLVVGVVVFLVITLVQFMVIGKGAERVAEVGARFTLDAMPGKQMSIDAAVRSGAIEEDEGQRRRDELGREAQFYGAMDGAMKFIKGDAIAGLVITALNLVAGLVIGVVRNGMPAGEAAEMYSILTVGDGLVSQIPALLITLSAGVLTTRVASSEPKAGLGGSLRSELLGSSKVLAIGAAFAFTLALFPGLPVAPFLVIAAALGATAYAKHRRTQRTEKKAEADTSFEKKLETRIQQAKAQRAQVDAMAPTVALVGVDLDPHLSEALGFRPGVDDKDTELLGALIPQLRDALYADTGIRFPGIRVRTRVPGLPRGTLVVKLKDVPVVTRQIDLDRFMAIESVARLARLGISATPGVHPLHDCEVGFVTASEREAVDAAGIMTWSPAGIVALSVAFVLRRNARMFVGLQETSDLLERMSKVYPALVSEVVPGIVSVMQLTEILRRLVDETVSIRDLKSILEAIAEYGPYENDGVALTELVRASLALQLGHAFGGPDKKISAILLDPVIEDSIRTAIVHTPGGSFVALEPQMRVALLRSIAETSAPVRRAGLRPAIITTAEIRRYVRKLIEAELPTISVLSFQELTPELVVEPVGRVSLDDDLLAAA